MNQKTAVGMHIWNDGLKLGNLAAVPLQLNGLQDVQVDNSLTQIVSLSFSS